MEALQQEREKRRNQETARFTRWSQDPVGFIEQILLGFVWSKQKLICESVAANRLTAVPSCHDVGKSAVAARLAAWWISVRPPGEAFVVTLAPTFHQVKGILWREINRVHSAGGLPGRTNLTEWWLGKELVGWGRSPADTDPTALQGIHALHVLVIFDEAGGISTELWDAASSLVANENSRFLAIGNPDDPTTEFQKVCRPGSGWKVIPLDAFESPNFTGEPIPDWLRPLLISPVWVDERRKSWGEGSMRWQSKIRGQFPEESTDALVPMAALNAAVKRGMDLEIPESADDLGADVARFGDDATVIYARKGFVTWRVAKIRKHDLMQVTGALMNAIGTLNPRRVKVDDLGLGGGVTDRLTELQGQGKIPGTCEIIGVNVGESPRTSLDDERFKNLRAEVNWGTRSRFVEGAVALIGDNDDLLAQASQIKYKFASDGSIQIESKADMKKRTKGVSPDDWDALVLCMVTPHWSGEAFLAMQPKTLEIKDAGDNRPWHTASQKEAATMAAAFNGNGKKNRNTYLHEAYNEGFKQVAKPQPTCKTCNRPITSVSRISDGVDSWHSRGDPECHQ